MKYLTSIHMVLITACLLAPSSFAQDNETPPENFTALFNGKDLAGWTGGTTQDPQAIKNLPDDQAKAHREKMEAGIAAHWRVEDGQLVSDGMEPHLVTDRDYSDFEMWVDWKLSKNGDSGIYLRGCPQVQIWDPTNEAAHPHGADKGSGGLWNNKQQGKDPSAIADKPIGQWNRMYIRMVGPYVTVKLNGTTVVENVPLENYYDRKRPVPMSGPIHLQTHGSETRFRNVFVREIDAEEANKYLAEISGDEGNYTPIFNGKDLTGWVGHTRDYIVKNGTILCGESSGGNIVTEKKYGDFIARMEFKLPPGGNNGIILRLPNAGGLPINDAIELQVLDNRDEAYKELKSYQYHGSAYGVSPALRGYLRPVGKWNHQQVEVVGDRIKVILNGYTILDIKMKEVAPKHHYLNNTTGHFGFTGHNSPVAFRNIRINEIERE